MPRAPREDYVGAWHHVMNRGAGHSAILASDLDKQLLIDCLIEGLSRHAIELHAYCLMSTHYHLLLRSNEAQLSAAMRFAAAKFSRIKNNRDGRDGPLFRGRFKSVEIETDSQLIQSSRYIHLNPVEAKLVPLPWEWRWSSAGAYVGEAAPPPWLQTSTILKILDPRGCRTSLRRHLEGGIDHSTRAFYLEQGL